MCFLQKACNTISHHIEGDILKKKSNLPEMLHLALLSFLLPHFRLIRLPLLCFPTFYTHSLHTRSRENCQVSASASDIISCTQIENGALGYDMLSVLGYDLIQLDTMCRTRFL